LLIQVLDELQRGQTKTFVRQIFVIENTFCKSEIYGTLILVEGVNELEKCMSLACVGKSCIIDIGLVKHCGTSESVSGLVFVQVKQTTPHGGVLGDNLFNQEQHSSLFSRWLMHLEESESLGKSYGHFSGILPLRHKN
jgi:hypothetical protein